MCSPLWHVHALKHHVQYTAISTGGDCSHITQTSVKHVRVFDKNILKTYTRAQILIKKSVTNQFASLHSLMVKLFKQAASQTLIPQISSV